MKNFAFYLDQDNEVTCERLTNILILDDKETIIVKATKQMAMFNKGLKEGCKHVKLIEVYEHGNGFTPKGHMNWRDDIISELKSNLNELNNVSDSEVEIKMLEKLEEARILSKSVGTIWCLSNGTKISTTTSYEASESMKENGFWTASIFEKGRRVEA